MAEPDNDAEDRDDLPIPVGSREPGDDFFCIRYRVWYPSFDCAIRTKYRTSDGCLKCDQGRFNLKRHASAVRAVRWRLPSPASGASGD